MGWKPTTASYLLTWVGLVLLSTLSLTLSLASLGPWGPPIALAIAAGKALLIALVFMHLAEQRPVHGLIVAASLLLVVFFVGLAAADVATRDSVDGAFLPAAAGSRGRIPPP